MGDRTYGQYCALAKALDVVGERWSLLVVRELLLGERRYTDLLAGLPGISTDMLATRLRNLEEAEVIARRVLPPPAASTVYELTPAGRELEPAILALARWGLDRIGEKKRGETFRIEWAELMLRTMFDAEQSDGPPLILELRVGDERLRIRIADRALVVVPSSEKDEAADVIVASDAAMLAQLARDPARWRSLAKERLRVSGSAHAIKRVNRMFGLAPI